jgi:hypothetical protein
MPAKSDHSKRPEVVVVSDGPITVPISDPMPIEKPDEKPDEEVR